MIQDAARQRNIHHLIPPHSEIEPEMSSVVRYQKYCVSDDISHSGTRFMTAAVVPLLPSATTTVSSTVGQ